MPDVAQGTSLEKSKLTKGRWSEIDNIPKPNSFSPNRLVATMSTVTFKKFLHWLILKKKVQCD